MREIRHRFLTMFADDGFLGMDDAVGDSFDSGSYSTPLWVGQVQTSSRGV